VSKALFFETLYAPIIKSRHRDFVWYGRRTISQYFNSLCLAASIKTKNATIMKLGKLAKFFTP
jgi:hypothetical protein